MDRKPLKIGDLTARIPVIQGGMGVGISLSHLAGSVAANGGVGILSAAQIGFREPDFEEHPKEANLRAIQSQLAKARALAGGGIVGFNIMVATKDYADYVKAAVKAGADLIISGAGLPEKLPEYVKGSNTKIAPIVSTEKAAKVMLRIWKRKYNVVPDLLVIEGPKAGGHLGFHREQLEIFTDETYAQEVKKILTVVREIEADSHKNIPVVLAGGIYDRAIWIGLWHLAWMAYRWGHALSRHTSVTQICLINRRTLTVKKNRSVLSKARSACRVVLFSIPLSNMVRIKLIKNVSIAWNTVIQKKSLTVSHVH